MSKNYFAIERNQKCWDHVVVKDKDGNVMFGNYLNMTYDEMKSQEDLEEFVVAIMDATGSGVDEHAVVTLVDENDRFIWSVIMGPGEDDGIRYVLVDWRKDGKSYGYAPENGA